MCYLINGLENPDLRLSISGTNHFAKNITPDMYTMTLAYITGEDLAMCFKPTANVPKEFVFNSGECCTLKIQAHKDLSLIVKQINGLTITYWFILPKDNYFQHYILKKTVENQEDPELMHVIKSGVSMLDLKNDGFIVAESGGNNLMPSYFSFA